MSDVVAAVDLGGTNCRLGLFDTDGTLVKSWKISSKPFQDPAAVAALLPDELRRNAGNSRLTAAGFALPGLIRDRSRIVQSPNFPAWNDIPVKDTLEAALGIPVVIENDANAYAIGEGTAGAATSFRTFAAVTLGTGVGGGIVIDGALYRGAHGFGGEIGHVVVHPSGPACGCGRKGCIESYASGVAMKRQMEKLTGLGLEPEDIFRLAGKKDKPALKVIDQAGYHLGIGLATIANLLDIEAVIIGGGIGQSFTLLEPSIGRGFTEHCFDVHREAVQIIPATLGDAAALHGAFKLATA